MPKEYRYTECGLDNVIIEGIEMITDHVGEDVYCIPNVRGLHKAIAAAIIRRDGGISGRELRYLRTEMGMTQDGLAGILQVSRVTVTRWETNKKPVDQHADFMIRMLVAEKLNIGRQLSVERLAKQCGWKSKKADIRIDGRDPKKYQPIAA